MTGIPERLLADVLAVYLPPGEALRSPAVAEQVPYSGLTDPPAVGPGDEATIAAVMQMLRGVVAATERAAGLPPPPPNALYGVLAGAELIMRWECLAGRGGEVPGLLPGFAYLATVLFLDRELALRRSNQVRRLVEAAGFEVR